MSTTLLQEKTLNPQTTTSLNRLLQRVEDKLDETFVPYLLNRAVHKHGNCLMTDNDCDCTLCNTRREKMVRMTSPAYLDKIWQEAKLCWDDPKDYQWIERWYSGGSRSYAREVINSEYNLKEQQIKKDVLYE